MGGGGKSCEVELSHGENNMVRIETKRNLDLIFKS